MYALGTVGYRFGDVCVSVPRLFFGYATGTNLMFPFRVGATVGMFAERPTVASLADAIARYRPTVLTNVPTMIGKLLEHDAVARAAGGAGLNHAPDEIGLWPAADVLESLRRAHATLPSERALDAWQRYVLAWRAACEAIGPERNSVQRSQQQRGYRVYEPDDSYAARQALDRHAMQLEEQLEAALLASLAEASPPESQAAIESVRRERRLGRVLAQAEGVAYGIGLETLHLENVLADALRSRPADCAAALAALEPTRDERIAAATALVAAAAAGDRAERAFVELVDAEARLA